MEQSVSHARFMADHMVIKLGKYLRILGYDADWDRSVRTHELIARANAEGRVFLTRNTRLPDQYPRPKSVLLLKSSDPVSQLRAVMTEYRLDPRSGLFSKCIRCNLVLQVVHDRESIRGFVHPNVYRSRRRFFICPGCGTVFWKGSHVANTCRKLGIEQNQQGD